MPIFIGKALHEQTMGGVAVQPIAFQSRRETSHSVFLATLRTRFTVKSEKNWVRYNEGKRKVAFA